MFIKCVYYSQYFAEIIYTTVWCSHVTMNIIQNVNSLIHTIHQAWIYFVVEWTSTETNKNQSHAMHMLVLQLVSQHADLYPLFELNTCTHIFFEPGGINSMLHAFLFPIPHKGLQISNFKRTFWKMEVDLLIEVLMHANINAIWPSPHTHLCCCAP